MTPKVVPITPFDAPPEEIRLVSAASVRPSRVRWGCDQLVPEGMLTVMVGQGGLGKSTECARLAAGWSRGTIPGDWFGTPVTVAIASAEDHRESVIVPRLMAAGADLARTHFLEHHIDGEAGDIAINGEVAALEAALVTASVRVLIVDTVVAHIPVAHDTYNEQSVRAVLKPLAKMAERNGMVVLGTMHLNRRDARDVLTRISGSAGFGNLARSVLLLADDPDDPEGTSRILALGKSNVGGHAPALKLSIQPATVCDTEGNAIATSKVVVEGESRYSSTDLLGVTEDGAALTAVDEAASFLQDQLRDGPVEARAVKDAAKAAGISVRTLWRASKRLGVKTNDREGFGPGHPSRWSLSAVPSQPSPPVANGSVGAVGRDGGAVGTARQIPPAAYSATHPPTEPYTYTPRARTREGIENSGWLPAGVRHSACPQCGATATVVSPARDELCARCAPVRPARPRGQGMAV